MKISLAEPQFQTPMMLQYLEIKKQYPDCILFFRLGDFYEMFLDDAKIGAEILDITLTARSRGKDGDIPMAGVPYHAVDSYLSKLVSAGYKVAICDQTSLPDGKGLVDREVIRVVTPGTNISNKGLEKKSNSYVVAVEFAQSILTVSLCDVTTGEVFYLEEKSIDIVKARQVIDDLFSKVKPVEGIVNQNFYMNSAKMSLFHNYPDFFVYHFEDWDRHKSDAKQKILQIYQEKNLHNLHLENKKTVVEVVAVLFGYLQYTQKVDLKHLQTIEQFASDEFLEMDRSTITNLELLQTLSGDKKNSLLALIDFTSTGMGGRLLKKWLVKPLSQQKYITERLDRTEQLAIQKELRETIVSSLRKIHDIERLISRLSLNFGSPRDLVSLKVSLQEALEVKQKLRSNKVLQDLVSETQGVKKVITLLQKSIVDDPPQSPKNGGFIQSGIDRELDSLKEITLKSREWMDTFETNEREKTGISSLKVKYNKVFGFYIEISKANLSLVPDTYERKQTLVNAERFITPELKHHEQIVLEAEDKIFDIEYRLFLKTVTKVLQQVKDVQQLAQEIAALDCLTSFATASIEYAFTRPEIVENNVLEIRKGRHPVIERVIGKHNFVPNDTILNQQNQQLIIITGPNMAGKSVLMRQTALIVLLAHIGSFVPALEAKIGLTDKIFVRSGASDAITEGLSTFMVEMIETARILHTATDRSLVVMDEIGRGTSTYDGISIAWSVAEQLISDQGFTPKTLFATHYHELQELEKKFPKKISNYHMEIENHDGEPIFLYVFKKGSASHSFGIQVAQLAGLPKQVIQRATRLMKKFDTDMPVIDLEEMEAIVNEGEDVRFRTLQEELGTIAVNTLTPLESLTILDTLIKKYGKH